MVQELTQSQIVAPEGEADLAGAVEPQPEVEPEGEQPGAETVAERTYTQAEWSKRESAKDREIAQYRQAYAQQAMQQQIAQAQAVEAQAQAQDRQAVDDGEITASEAAQNQQRRQQEAQQEHLRQQQLAVAQRTLEQAEQAGRIMAAQDFSKKYEIDLSELLGDESLTTPTLMEAKAAKVALEKARGELKAAKTGAETFDSGQVGSVGVNLDKLSPEEKIAYGLAHPPKRQR